MDRDLTDEYPDGHVLVLRSLSKHYGRVRAVDRVSLSVVEGEFLSLLGPSGCGKTTLLRLIAGLEVPSEGTMRLGDTPIDDLPPSKREMGLVVQNYALFPHLDVFENVAYGLRVRRVREKVIRRRVAEALDLVRLSGFADRLPRQLSGGQQQRCALARAVAIRPRLLLLDEALGALDKKLREDMQVELRQLQRRLNLTTIHVTHDQGEALGMSDRIVVLNDGRIEQIDSPSGLYERPKTEFVANFIGEVNLFRATVRSVDQQGRLDACTPQGDILSSTESGGARPGDEITLAVRPEYMMLSDEAREARVNSLAGTIGAMVYHGSSTKIVIETTAGGSLIVYRPNIVDGASLKALEIGAEVRVWWPSHAARPIGESRKP